MSCSSDLSLKGSRVLVAEDEMFIAYDVVAGIEDAGGEVLGPVATIAEAMALVEATMIDGAVLDVNLLDGDVMPVLSRLLELGVAAIINTGTARPGDLRDEFPDVPIYIKPTAPDVLARALAEQVHARRARAE